MNLTGQKVIKGFGTDKSILNFKKKHFHKDKPQYYSQLSNSKFFKFIYKTSKHILQQSIIIYKFFFYYLNFKVTTANTTDKIVTTQNLTAILLS